MSPLDGVLLVAVCGATGIGLLVVLIAVLGRPRRDTGPRVDPLEWLTDTAERQARYGADNLGPRPPADDVPPRVLAAVEAVARSRPGEAFTTLQHTPALTYWTCPRRWPTGLDPREVEAFVAAEDADHHHVVWNDRTAPAWGRDILLAVYRHRFECALDAPQRRHLRVVGDELAPSLTLACCDRHGPDCTNGYARGHAPAPARCCPFCLAYVS